LVLESKVADWMAEMEGGKAIEEGKYQFASDRDFERQQHSYEEEH